MFLTEAIQPHSPFLTSFLVVKIILKTRALLGALAGTEGLQMFIKQVFYLLLLSEFLIQTLWD